MEIESKTVVVKGSIVLEQATSIAKLVYVDDKMVASSWEETIEILENDLALTFETGQVAMHRALASLGMSAKV